MPPLYASVTGVDPWAEFGLLGLVVGVLALNAKRIVDWALTQREKDSLAHSSEREAVRQEHREERERWHAEAIAHQERVERLRRESDTRRDERMQAALGDLARVIREDKNPPPFAD